MTTKSTLFACIGISLAIAFSACSNTETSATTPNQSTTGAAGNAEANTAGTGARTPNGSTSNPGGQR